MKTRKLALILLCAALMVILLGFVSTFFMEKYALKDAEKSKYYISASSYPVYAISDLIVKDVPGMHLSLLTQPQQEGYSAYSLSDWDEAILSQADIAVFMGFGFEGFAESYSSDTSAIITLLSLMELKGVPEGCEVLDFSDGTEFISSPWVYLSVDGLKQLLEVICGNMAYLDQEYSTLYYENLDKAYGLIDKLSERLSKIDCLNGVKLAVAHEAFLYTAYDLNTETALFIRRSAAQELSDEQIEQSVKAMTENGVGALLIEDQADEALINAAEAAGINVIRLSLMLDMSSEFGGDGLFDAFKSNLDAIEEAFAN